ncbi:interleukin-1 beta-like [Stegastes partitus]|uniref:Interleukin-1 beta n=1 Tax=Stegastes partitus TaxID=144197 RepID=A0A9Y4NK81_9TELE|nr:PREDICTED: interleukin-1 beta-like [Stegastes partitus]
MSSTMSEFDLSQALPSPIESDEKIIEHCYFDMTELQVAVITPDEDLDLKVPHKKKTLRSAANLILILNRMTESPSCCIHQLSEDELCSIVMDSLVEETVVETFLTSNTGQKKVTFRRVNSVKQFTLCDSVQKDLVQQSGELKLQALTLKGGHYQCKVNFKMARYVTPCVPAADVQTVLLSINNDLHMSCTMIDDTPVLTLERCREDELKMISDDQNMDRFLFFKRHSAMTLYTFESVKHRGWFISTSTEDENHSVEMCKVDAASRLTSFKLN